MERFANIVFKKKPVRISNQNMRSEMISEIISSKPGYFARFALIWIFTILMALFIAAWFIPFPDTIGLQAKVISSQLTSKIYIGGTDSFPLYRGSYYAEFFIPQKYFSKIHKGSSVELRIEAYPHNEYGTVQGQISYLSSFASDSGFLACVQLPRNALTSRNRTIEYYPGLHCEALIILKEGHLLEKLYKGLIPASK